MLTYARLMEAADAFCAAGEVISLAPDAEVYALRRWTVEEFSGSTTGPFPGPGPGPAVRGSTEGNGLPRGALSPYGVKVSNGRVDRVGVSLTPDETYDAAVTAAVPALAAGLAALFAVFVPLHLIVSTALCGSSWRPWPRAAPLFWAASGTPCIGARCPTTWRSLPPRVWSSSLPPTRSCTWY